MFGLPKLDFSRKDRILAGMVKSHQSFAEHPLVHKVGFLLVDAFALMSYASASEPLRAANHLAGRELYEVHHISVGGARANSSGSASVKTMAQIGEGTDFDYLFVCAGPDPQAFRDKRVMQWLRLLSRRGVVLGGVSGGPVILAAAGLMMTLNFIVGRRLPRALIPIAAGLAMIGMAVWSEYNWFERNRDNLPDGFEIVVTNESRAAWRPWTYVYPFTDRFIAVQPDAAMTNPAAPGQVLVELTSEQRDLEEVFRSLTRGDDEEAA